MCITNIGRFIEIYEFDFWDIFNHFCMSEDLSSEDIAIVVKSMVQPSRGEPYLCTSELPDI